MEVLPKEIWLHIFKYLDGQSLKEVEKSCVVFSEWLEDEIFWFNKCKAAVYDVAAYPEINLTRSKTKISWRELYVNLISPYKYLLGYWQKFTANENEYRGNLFKFFLFADLGLIYGHISHFEGFGHEFQSCVTIHSDGEFSSHASVESYPLGVTKHQLLCEPVHTCCEQRPLDEYSTYMHRVYSQEVIEFSGLEAFIKEEVSQWVKLRPFAAFSNDVIAPAVYESRYGPHGKELIFVHELKAEKKIIGSKLLGDPNVPFGKHTFVIDLNRPVVLNLAQQETIESLRAVNIEPVDGATSAQQPFAVPDGVYCDLSWRGKYNTCLERYAGKGTLAEDRYTTPWTCNTHFIRFNDDHFAIYFDYEEGQHLGFYSRKRDIVF